MDNKFVFKEGVEGINKASLFDLYNSVGWISYTKEPEKLFEAISKSTFVISCFCNNSLIGLARCVSDDVSINYIQDVLVKPDFQSQGIGKTLLMKCLERFKHVRTNVILTDTDEKQIKFYEASGFKNIKSMPFNVFVLMNQ